MPLKVCTSSINAASAPNPRTLVILSAAPGPTTRHGLNPVRSVGCDGDGYGANSVSHLKWRLRAHREVSEDEDVEEAMRQRSSGLGKAWREHALSLRAPPRRGLIDHRRLSRAPLPPPHDSGYDGSLRSPTSIRTPTRRRPARYCAPRLGADGSLILPSLPRGVSPAQRRTIRVMTTQSS